MGSEMCIRDRDQQGPGSRRIPGKKEGLSLTPHLGRRLAMDIENPAAVFIPKDIKGLYEEANTMLSPLPAMRVFIRMSVENQPAVGSADLFPTGTLADSQDVVVIQLMAEVRGIPVVHSTASAGTRQVGAVQHDRNRPIIIEPDIHMSPEYSLPGADST